MILLERNGGFGDTIRLLLVNCFLIIVVLAKHIISLNFSHFQNFLNFVISLKIQKDESLNVCYKAIGKIRYKCILTQSGYVTTPLWILIKDGR
ncbi:MAG: hypothetical protein A2079_03085 [Geobacteraceae bacterium GWC2_48_7]|nr:MAG: hypothetical protein A2079_03085 [Geobacteraceae bacterium GWC2_48_7]